MNEKIIVNEIFLSIQGESIRMGLPCSFIRLTGCNLRCNWCDTQYALEQGKPMSIEDILKQVKKLACRRVEVTGGEPLFQRAALGLLTQLVDAGYETLLETNGSIDISPVDERVIKIVDFKCPSSGQQDSTHWRNVEHLNKKDEVKFVIADSNDYKYAKLSIDEYGLAGKCAVIFSPVAEKLDPAKLAKWIIGDGLDVRLGLQLHKIIWPNIERGV